MAHPSQLGGAMPPEQVGFAYRARVAVLHKISFSAVPGQTVQYDLLV
jgi:hypothetical protein